MIYIKDLHELSDDCIERVDVAIDTARKNTVDLVENIKDKTYMNFVRPLMDIDAKLNDVLMPIFHLDSVNNSDRTKQVVNDVLPKVSTYSTDMGQYVGLYEGYKFVLNNDNTLNDIQKKLVKDTIRSFEISGITLPDEIKDYVKEINLKLSNLSNDFTNNLIEANKSFKLNIVDEKLLGNMPESDKSAAKTDSGWEFSLLDAFYEPFMTYVIDRDLRKKMHEARYLRAPNNFEIISKMLALRQELATILGYDNYASLVFEDRSAPSVDKAKDFLRHIKSKVTQLVLVDENKLVERAFIDGIIDFAPYDVSFYTNLVQDEQYGLDESLIREYFELNSVRDSMFEILKDMFDIQFVESKTSESLWHKDVKSYWVNSCKENIQLGSLFIDYTTRESKSPGAWMNSFSYYYRDSKDVIHLPSILNVCNFPQNTDDEPSLLTIRDIQTMFHEMGHGLHGLLSKVPELAMSGTGVDRDVVEFPSMFLEYFWNNPIVLKRLGKHYKTGEVISDDLVEKIIKSDSFMRGVRLDWLASYSLFDLEIHSRLLSLKEVKDLFEEYVPKDSITPGAGYDRPLTAFLHPFGHGYAAGYYSYLWAEQLAADAYLAANKDPFNKEVLHKYRDVVLAQGGSKKMDIIYREFLGRDPNPESLLIMYGLN